MAEAATKPDSDFKNREVAQPSDNQFRASENAMDEVNKIRKESRTERVASAAEPDPDRVRALFARMQSSAGESKPVVLSGRAESDNSSKTSGKPDEIEKPDEPEKPEKNEDPEKNEKPDQAKNPEELKRSKDYENQKEADKPATRTERRADGSVVDYENHRPVKVVDAKGTTYQYEWKKYDYGTSLFADAYMPSKVTITEPKGDTYEFEAKNYDDNWSKGLEVVDKMYKFFKGGGDSSLPTLYRGFQNGKEIADDKADGIYPANPDVDVNIKPDGTLSIDEPAHGLHTSFQGRRVVYNYNLDGSRSREIRYQKEGLVSSGKHDFKYEYHPEGQYWSKVYTAPPLAPPVVRSSKRDRDDD